MRMLSCVVGLLALAGVCQQAHAATAFITFDDRPTGPSFFTSASPSPQTVVYPEATFSGGVILGNASNFPAQGFASSPNVYGTANFGNNLSNLLTMDFSVAVNEVSFPLFNGQTVAESYIASAYDASNNLLTSQTLLNVAANSNSGYGIFDLQALGIMRVLISTLNPAAPTFDFFIDSVALNQSVQDAVTGVPGPVAGAGLPLLVALGGLVWARRRREVATPA